jgi:glutathione S-transferase
MLTLYTFNISHFSEKARWALDFEGIRYQESVLLPGPHMLVTRRLSKRTNVPLLVHDGQVVQESSVILDYIAEQLGGSKLVPRNQKLSEARALELEIDRAFGVGVQRVLYNVMLKERRLVSELWTFGGPKWGRLFYALAYPGVARVVDRMYQTSNTPLVDESRELFLRTFDKLDALLEKQPYLGGEAPNRVDITSAALLAPVCRPPQHRMPWPEAPEGLRAFEAQLRGRPTWNHALRMYKDHRAPAA